VAGGTCAKGAQRAADMSQSGRSSIRDCFATARESNRRWSRRRSGGECRRSALLRQLTDGAMTACWRGRDCELGRRSAQSRGRRDRQASTPPGRFANSISLQIPKSPRLTEFTHPTPAGALAEGEVLCPHQLARAWTSRGTRFRIAVGAGLERQRHLMKRPLAAGGRLTRWPGGPSSSAAKQDLPANPP